MLARPANRVRAGKFVRLRERRVASRAQFPAGPFVTRAVPFERKDSTVNSATIAEPEEENARTMQRGRIAYR